MNRTVPIGALVGALGCAPRVELPDVPIVGGTPEARHAAQAELERFDGWVGAGRLRIREIRFEDLDGQVEGLDVSGRWLSNRDLILVESDLPHYDVADVVRHELCHALDGAEDLSPREGSFSRLGADLAYLQDEAGAASEAFALACERAPLAAAVASVASCRGDDSDQFAALSFLADEVWTGDVPRDPAAPLGDALGGFALSRVFEPVDSWIVLPSLDPDRVEIRLSLEIGSVAVVEADFTTGTQLPSEHGDSAPEADTPPPGLSFGDPAVFVKRGWPEGPGAAVLTWPVRNQPWLPSRLVVHDGEAWRPVADTCPGDEGIFYGLFTARDEIWYAWDDGEAIYWAPVSTQ